MALTPEERQKIVNLTKSVSTQPTTKPKKQGFFRTLGQEIIEPFAKVAATGEKAASNLLLGKGVKTDEDFTKNVLGRQVGPAKTPTEFAGAVIEAGSNFIPVGAGAKVAGQALKTGVKTVGIKSLLKGAGRSSALTGVSGGLSGAGEALQEPTVGIKDILSRAGVGAGLGAGVGVVAPLAGRGIQSTLAKAGSKKADEAVQVVVKQKDAIKAPKVAKELEEVGFQKDVQNLIKKADDTVKNDMVDLFKRASQKSSSRLQAQPIFKLGQDLLGDIKTLSKEATSAANIIKKEVAKAQNVVVKTDRARKNFVRDLKNLDVGVTNDGKLLFDNSRIQNAADQKIVQDMLDFVSKPQGVKDIYRKNQTLFDQLKLGSKNNELSVAEGVTNRLRSDLKKIVGQRLPINEAQKTYAKIEQTLTPINKVLGSKYTPEDLATAKASEIIGRLLNRNAGRPTEIIRDIIRESAKLQGKNADKAWSDFLRKVEFTDVLEDVFGLSPSRSFKSQVGKGATEALTDVALDFVPYGGTIKTVTKGFLGREKPLRDKQVEALKGLLGIK